MSHEDPAQPLGDPDLLYESALERVAARAPARFDRLVLRATDWFGEHPTIRLISIVAFMALAVGQAIVLLIFDDQISQKLSGASYFSIFITNLASTATFFIPVPGLTAAAQTLIATQGESSDLPWLIGVAGGAGMAAGEITAYYGGYLGAELVRGRELPGPRAFHGTIERVVRWVNWLMDRWGMLTLFTLSAIPNPAFEIAGLTAGSVRMSFRRFIVSVTAGKIVRGVLIAYYGQDFLDGLRALFQL
ncbi:MAG: VTT domain-containing protein [Chloroflexi bacterium]|nr:VTT domain-containing protein [Chloroflexota bacterium]